MQQINLNERRPHQTSIERSNLPRSRHESGAKWRPRRLRPHTKSSPGDLYFRFNLAGHLGSKWLEEDSAIVYKISEVTNGYFDNSVITQTALEVAERLKTRQRFLFKGMVPHPHIIYTLKNISIFDRTLHGPERVHAGRLCQPESSWPITVGWSLCHPRGP
jgi:hypothetical protein